MQDQSPLLNCIFNGLDLPETAETEKMDQQVKLEALKVFLGRLLDLSATPKMIVLEDAHTMDNHSWELAFHITKNRPRLLLVCVYAYICLLLCSV